MSTFSRSVSSRFLDTGHPMSKRSSGSCNVLVAEPKICAKRVSNLRVVACQLDVSGIAFRRNDRYKVNISEGYTYSLETKPSAADHSHSGAETNSRPTVLNAVPKPRVILIAGPTAVGKTRLSIELAKALGGVIINGGSVQVYRGLDIGAAKATLSQRQGVPHHLIDVVPPTEDYPYERFLADARAATEEILARGKVPIVIAGTGLYMRYFMHNKPDHVTPLRRRGSDGLVRLRGRVGLRLPGLLSVSAQGRPVPATGPAVREAGAGAAGGDRSTARHGCRVS